MLTLFLRRWGWRRRRFNGGRGFRQHAFIYACSLRGWWYRFFGHGLLLSLFKKPAGFLRLPPALLQLRRFKLDIGGFRHGQQFSDDCFFLRGFLIVFHEVNEGACRRSVHLRVGGHVGVEGHVFAQGSEDVAPQAMVVFSEHRGGIGGDREPRSGSHFVFQLAGRPA